MYHAYGSFRKPKAFKNPRILKAPYIDHSEARGYFDGASQGSMGICGVGNALYLSRSHYITSKSGCGLELTT
jgi:hypothetical protein